MKDTTGTIAEIIFVFIIFGITLGLMVMTCVVTDRDIRTNGIYFRYIDSDIIAYDESTNNVYIKNSNGALVQIFDENNNPITHDDEYKIVYIEETNRVYIVHNDTVYPVVDKSGAEVLYFNDTKEN